MNDLGIFLKNLFRYKGSIALNIFFNVLYVLTSAFSITLIAPFVSVLFGMVPPVEELPAFAWNMESLLGSCYYYISRFQLAYGTMTALLLLGLVFVAVTLVSNTFRYFAFYFLSNIRSGLLRDLRTDFYTHILTLPVGYFSEQRKGDLLSRFNNDVGEVERGVVCSLQGAIMEPLFVLIFTTGLFVINWKLSLAILVAFPLVMYVSGRVGVALKKKSKTAQQLLGGLVSRVEEGIAGLRIIKSFNLIELAERRFKEENLRYVREANAIQRRKDLAGPLTEMMLIGVTLAVMFFGGLGVVNGAMPADMFILFVLLLIKVISPAKHTVAAYYDIQKGRAALERVYAVLRRPPADLDAADALPVKTFEKEIRYEDVCFSYGVNGEAGPLGDGEVGDEQTGVRDPEIGPLGDGDAGDEQTGVGEPETGPSGVGEPVLNHINLTFEKGKTYAFVGASGAGKTTAADLLSRFYEPVSGRILWDGKDMATLRRSDIRALVGTVSQLPFVWHDTVAENIRFGREGVSREEIVEAAKKAYAHDFIMQLPDGYDTVLGDNGANLSGGQRQRIVIARAILKNAPVLVLDEATSALDTESEDMVRKALEDLMQGRTAIVIAHRLSTIRHADEIIVFEKGRIVERGTHSELVAKGGAYSNFVELQSL